MISPEDCDRALAAWKLAENPGTRVVCQAVVHEYLAEIIRKLAAAAAAQNIANGRTGNGGTAP